MNQQEIQNTIDAVRQFIREYRDMISEVSLSHLERASFVMEAIRPLTPEAPVTPATRTNGLCPCELADAAKAVSRAVDRQG